LAETMIGLFVPNLPIYFYILLFYFIYSKCVNGIARGNHSFAGLVNPLTEGQNPVRLFYIKFLAILPYVNDKF